MRLLVFDPGETTGWSFLADGKIIGGSFSLWSEVKPLITIHRPTVVLFESFNLRAGAARHLIGSSFPTIQVIGVIQYVADEAGITCVSKGPAYRSGIYLKGIKGFDRHARDATKHGLRYLAKAGYYKEYRHYRGQRRNVTRF